MLEAFLKDLRIPMLEELRKISSDLNLDPQDYMMTMMALPAGACAEVLATCQKCGTCMEPLERSAR